MKVNYTTPLEAANTSYPDYINATESNLDELVCDNEAEHILAINALDRVYPPQIVPLLNKLISKLAHGGSIKFGGNEAFMLATLLNRGDIDIEAFNTKMYGQNNKSCLNVEVLCGMLDSAGLKITSKEITDDGYMMVEALRP